MQQKHLGNYRKSKKFPETSAGWTFVQNSKHLAMGDLYV